MLALETWPEMSARQIADQIGVNSDYANDIRRQVSDTLHLPERVTGKDGKSYPASRAGRSPGCNRVDRVSGDEIEGLTIGMTYK